MIKLIRVFLALVFCALVGFSLAENSSETDRDIVWKILNANRRDEVLKKFSKYTIYLSEKTEDKDIQLYQVCYNDKDGQMNVDYSSPFTWIWELYDDATKEIGYYPDSNEFVDMVNATGEKLEGGFFNLLDAGRIIDNYFDIKQLGDKLVIYARLTDGEASYYYGDLVSGFDVQEEFTVDKETLLMQRLDVFRVNEKGNKDCIETDLYKYGESDETLEVHHEAIQEYRQKVATDLSTREITVILTDDDGNLNRFDQKVLKHTQIHVMVPENYKVYNDNQFINAYTAYAGGSTEDTILYAATEMALTKTRTEDIENTIRTGIKYYENGDYEHAYLTLDLAEQLRENELLILGKSAYELEQYGYAASRFFDAAIQGNAEAQYLLAYCLYYGIGFEKNEADAYYWFDLAAVEGEKHAQYYAGLCYRDGIGTQTDEEAAFYYIREAAEQELMDAQYELAHYYENGIGTEQNTEKAIYWYTKAANAGHYDSQCYLSSYYEERNVPESIYWAMRSVGIDNNITKHTEEELQGLIEDANQAINLYHTLEEQSWNSAFGALEDCINEHFTSGRIGAKKEAYYIKEWDLITIGTTVTYTSIEGVEVTSSIKADVIKNNGAYEVSYLLADNKDVIIDRHDENIRYWTAEPSPIPNLDFNLELSTIKYADLLTIIDSANKAIPYTTGPHNPNNKTPKDEEKTIDKEESCYYLTGVRTVNAGNNGYQEIKEINSNDLHFGWDLGTFYVTGFSAIDFEENGTPVFTKAIGDEIKLHYQLKQDINQLNDNPALTISEDSNGFDYEFETKKSNIGRGTLFIRHTDYQGKQKKVTYTNYLSAWNHGANTEVATFEEGNYSVALDYEIRGKSFAGDIVNWFDSVNNYRARFDFKVRNGNANAFMFDCISGQELRNNSVTSNGFVVDFADSHYLKVTVKREKIDISDNVIKKNVLMNDVAYDMNKYVKEGLYTIAISNKTSVLPTIKVIYVGLDPDVIHYVTSGLAYEDAIKGE